MTTPYINTTPRYESRYSRALEQAPGLMARLQDASTAEIGLRDEVGLARTMLDEALAAMAPCHARNGSLPPAALAAVMSMLQQVQGIVRDAAAIEAKRTDQRISATHVLTLLAALRDDLKRALYAGFGEHAAAVVDDAFSRARWTGGLRDEDVKDALLEPAAFDFRLRIVDREGDAIKESARAHGLHSAEIAAVAAHASDLEDPLAIPGESVDAEQRPPIDPLPRPKPPTFPQAASDDDTTG